MRYLNEEQEQQFNGLLQRYADEQESLTVRSGRTIVYRGTPGSNPEIDRITPQQLENLSNAINKPEQATGSIKISKEQSYQVQNGQQADNNTLRPLERSQKAPSQSPEMAELLSQVASLKQYSIAQSDRTALWEKEMREMREVIARQEQLLKQATTPVHKKLGNWFDQQKERVGNWLEQHKERIGNRIEGFKDNIQSSFSNAKQQVIANIEEFRDGIKVRLTDAKQQTRANIDRFTGVAELQQSVKRLQEVLRLQSDQQQKLSQELGSYRDTQAVAQPSAKLSAQQAQAAPVPPINEHLDKSVEIQTKEIAQLNDRQKADFNRLVSQLEQQKLIELRSKQIERKQFDAGTPLVPQYLEFKQAQERERLATELADKQRYSQPPVLELSLGGGKNQADPWYHLAKAPEDLQIRSGIIPPINITPAGAAWYSQFVADGKRLQAEEMVTAEKERLKSAGFSPKQIESREKGIREKAFGQVGEEWKQERAEALKKWQESKAENSFQSFVQTQPALTQSEPQKISSPENSTKSESDKQGTSLAADKPYGPVLVLNNNGNVRCQHQEPKHTPEVRANNPNVEQQAQSTKTPEQTAGTTREDSQKQKSFQQVAETQATKNGQQPQQQQVLEQQSIPKVQNGAIQNGATPQPTNKTGIENKGQQRVQVSELKQWRKEAEALGIHGSGYLNKIDKLTELAEQKAGSGGRVTLKESDSKRMQADRQEFKELTKGQAQTQTQARGMRM